MGYAKEFNHEQYTIPKFITSNSDWKDVSWHNDASPRFENKEIGLAVWVETDDPELREFDDWKRLTIVRVVGQDDEILILADDYDYATDDDADAERWITLFQVRTQVEAAQYYLNQLKEPCEEIADGLADTLAWLNTYMKQNEAPDCSPAGELQ